MGSPFLFVPHLDARVSLREAKLANFPNGYYIFEGGINSGARDTVRLFKDPELNQTFIIFESSRV